MSPVAVSPSSLGSYGVPPISKEKILSSYPMHNPLPEASTTPRWRPTETQNRPRAEFAFDRMEDALAAFARGEFLVVMDDEDRENEGDLIIAASDRLEELDIPMMVPQNQERHRTAYTVTVDYKHGTTTGISARDRCLTARALASPSSQPSDFTRPGHMVPLRAREGGVLTRKGHTESAVDLCRLVDLPPAGLLCELVNDDAEGSMARRDDCRAFADRWGIKMISVQMLVEWRRRLEAQK